MEIAGVACPNYIRLQLSSNITGGGVEVNEMLYNERALQCGQDKWADSMEYPSKRRRLYRDIPLDRTRPIVSTPISQRFPSQTHTALVRVFKRVGTRRHNYKIVFQER